MPRSSNRYGDGDDKPDLENPHYYHPDKEKCKECGARGVHFGECSLDNTNPPPMCNECGGLKGHPRHGKCSVGWPPNDAEGQICEFCGAEDGAHGGQCRTITCILCDGRNGHHAANCDDWTEIDWNATNRI